MVGEAEKPQHVNFNLSVRLELPADRTLHFLGAGTA
jgi:hypothetical protein